MDYYGASHVLILKIALSEGGRLFHVQINFITCIPGAGGSERRKKAVHRPPQRVAARNDGRQFE